jgi:HlyD family secretion protein
MRSKIFMPMFSLGLLLFAIYHVVTANQMPPKPQPPFDPPKAPVGSRVIAGSAVVEPKSENIAIGSHLPGVIQEIYVKVGQKVKKGDPLFKLDDRQLKAELSVRQAYLEATQASLQKLEQMPRSEELPPIVAKVDEARAMMEDARDQFNRTSQAFDSRAISEEELIRRKYTLANTKASLARAEAELRLLKAGSWEYEKKIANTTIGQATAQLEQTRTELERLNVRAPLDSEILQSNVRLGEFVGAQPNSSLMILGDVSDLHVRIDIDENDISRFDEKMPGKAMTRGGDKREYQIRFVRVEPYVIPKKSLSGAGTERVDTRVLQAIYRIEKPDRALFVGQQLDVYLELPENAKLSEPAKMN